MAVIYSIGNLTGFGLREAAMQIIRGYEVSAVEGGFILARAYLSSDRQRFVFEGRTGRHTIDASGQDVDRVEAHLSGFVENNRQNKGRWSNRGASA